MKLVNRIILFGMIMSMSAVSFGKTVNLNYKNTVIFSGEVDPASVETLMMSLLGKEVIAKGEGPIYLLIVTGGGGYDSALEIKRIIDATPDLVLICKECQSVGGLIFSTSKAKRLVFKKTHIMMHEMYIDHITARQVRKDADVKYIVDRLKKASDEFDMAMYTTMGMSKEAYENKIANKMWDVNGQDAVKLKLADEFVTISCDPRIKNIAPDTCGE